MNFYYPPNQTYCIYSYPSFDYYNVSYFSSNMIENLANPFNYNIFEENLMEKTSI